MLPTYLVTAADPLRPGRPGVCAYARIDEVKVSGTDQGAAWLTSETHWFHLAGMLTITNPTPFGGTVYLHCHSRARAQELVDLAVRNGVPANCAKVADQLDKPKAKPRAATAYPQAA